MASVLALREGWTDSQGKVEPLDFVINDTFKNLRDAVNSGETAFYMWERYTTKPYVDSGENRFIDFIPTPWPSWAIAATPSTDKQTLDAFLEKLTVSVRKFDSVEARAKDDVDFVVKQFGYEEEDVKNWLMTVKYPTDCAKLPKSVVLDTLRCVCPLLLFEIAL